MTEKRFTHDWSNDFKREVVTDHHNSDYEMMEKQCCELLNKLSEENEQLKQSLKRQQSSNDECSKYIEEVIKENGELKKEVKQLKNKIKTYNSTHELLKETIDRLKNNG